MKTLLLTLLVTSIPFAEAKDYILSNAKAEYTVKHIFKTVKGQSSDLKGKMVCENNSCEFLVAISSKSFVSSDSNRDLNLQTILEVTKYPLITVKGVIPEAELEKTNYEIKSKINFHGTEKDYILKITKSAQISGQVVLQLEDHKVERPSLLMAKIDNEVPVDFSFDWKE